MAYKKATKGADVKYIARSRFCRHTNIVDDER